MEEDEVQTRGRLDWIDTRGSSIVDAKFTNNIDPKMFGHSAAGFGYRPRSQEIIWHTVGQGGQASCVDAADASQFHHHDAEILRGLGRGRDSRYPVRDTGEEEKPPKTTR